MVLWTLVHYGKTMALWTKLWYYVNKKNYGTVEKKTGTFPRSMELRSHGRLPKAMKLWSLTENTWYNTKTINVLEYIYNLRTLSNYRKLWYDGKL